MGNIGSGSSKVVDSCQVRGASRVPRIMEHMTHAGHESQQKISRSSEWISIGVDMSVVCISDGSQREIFVADPVITEAKPITCRTVR